MSLLGLANEMLPVGLAVLLPLGIAFYGWRALGMASAAAGAVKLALGVAVGVALEALRRTLGLSYGEVWTILVDGAMWVVDNLGGLLG